MAARAAVQERAAALVVDVAGPVPFVVEGEDLPPSRARSRCPTLLADSAVIGDRIGHYRRLPVVWSLTDPLHRARTAAWI